MRRKEETSLYKIILFFSSPQSGKKNIRNINYSSIKNIMTDKEKLQALIEKFANGNQQAFASIIGVPRSNISTWMHRGSITANGREAILDAFPQVSREWLMEGSSTASSYSPRSLREADLPMIVSASDSIHFSRRDLIPYFESCRASCGIVEQLENPEYINDYVLIPGVHARAAIPAEGDSMLPTIHDGDICLVGEEVQLDDISGQGIYLIVTTEGHCMFKRIYDEGRKSNHILALSENPAYVPHAKMLPKDELLHLYPLLHVVHSVEE